MEGGEEEIIGNLITGLQNLYNYLGEKEIDAQIKASERSRFSFDHSIDTQEEEIKIGESEMLRESREYDAPQFRSLHPQHFQTDNQSETKATSEFKKKVYPTIILSS